MGDRDDIGRRAAEPGVEAAWLAIDERWLRRRMRWMDALLAAIWFGQLAALIWAVPRTKQRPADPGEIVFVAGALAVIFPIVLWWVRRKARRWGVGVVGDALVVAINGQWVLRFSDDDRLIVSATAKRGCWTVYVESRPRVKRRLFVDAFPTLDEFLRWHVRRGCAVIETERPSPTFPR